MMINQSKQQNNRIKVDLDEFGSRIAARRSDGWRLGHLTARRQFSEGNDLTLVAIMLSPTAPHVEVWEAKTPIGSTTFPSITHDVPSAHWFERFIYDLFGLLPEGHPRFKSVIFHGGWPEDFFPLLAYGDKPPTALDKPRDYGFIPVHGEGVFEIAVGPIHAGIIEPGHFRFSCLGEEIQNLDIRLGYLHRGIEKRLEGCPLVKARLLAESASSDTTVGNSLAYAIAIESLLGIDVSKEALRLRTTALELERVANHVGDLGGVSGDMGFLGGASTFGRIRGRVLGIAERLTGSRFMTAYILPGGVARGISADMRLEIISEVEEVEAAIKAAEPILLDNFGALERMEGIGILRPGLARDLGVVGPAGRAGGVRYDVREFLMIEPYISCGWQAAYEVESDVYARVRVKASEIAESLKVIRKLTAGGSSEVSPAPPDDVNAKLLLPPNRVGVGVVEAWRGELIHTIFTGPDGKICRYAIKDPSTNNWPGLAHAVRGETVSDFPLCNKSFSLSYSGNDL
jgi:Ni,Fe-hydrogenase III large subunit/Ni,Fe-hydrogenase III component G